MDTYEATKVVFTRIQSLDPENASKIMGFILLQDQGEKEMIRLAFGPETLLLSLINKAKSCFGLSSNASSATRGVSSPRIIVPAAANGFHHHHQHINPPSPSSPWSVSGFSDHRSPVMSPRPPASSLSYAAVVNGSGNGGSGSFSSSPNGSFQAPFYGGSNNGSGDLQDEYSNLPFLDGSGVNGGGGGGGEFMDPIMSPSGRSDSILFPYGSGGGGSSWADSGGPEETHHHLHRRSFSVSDVYLGGGGGGGSDDGGGGFGWRPCMYFARGFCKNGNTCKFSHGGFADSGEVPAAIVGSPSKFDGVDELLKMKAIQQQRFAAASQLMAAGGAPFPYNKCMNLLNDTQRSAAAALMMGDEFHKFDRCHPERNGFSDMGFCGNANSSSRQIYLTFPADSTFKEEDVSNYFSLYGPVQDVRIPYQQKRMFGFVTFVYAETVKIILAKGNPHFVCDSRVLVKPYKEKGKIPDKKQQGQQMDRGDFGGCLSPSALDNREPFDLPIGARMFYNTQEMLLRKKFEEQAELHHAIELQGRRMMNLQLMDLKNHHHNHQFHSSPSPTQSHTQSLVLQSDDVNQENSEENNGPPDGNNSPTVAADQKLQHEVNESCNNNNGSDREESVNLEDSDLPESLEHILPDNLFASPTKSAGDHSTIFSTTSTELEDTSTVTTSSSSNSGPMLPTTSTLNMASLQSCYFQMPRFSSGQEAIEM